MRSPKFLYVATSFSFTRPNNRPNAIVVAASIVCILTPSTEGERTGTAGEHKAFGNYWLTLLTRSPGTTIKRTGRRHARQTAELAHRSKVSATTPVALGRRMQRHGLRRVGRFARHSLDRQFAGLFPGNARLAC